MKANLTTTLSFLATLAIAAVTTGSDSLEGRADTPTPTVSPTPSPAPFSDVESSSSSAAPDEKATRALAEPWRPWRSVAARALWAHYRIAKGREGVSS